MVRGCRMTGSRAFFFQRIECVFIGVISLRQLALVEIVGRIAVAKLRVIQNVFFGLIVSGFIWIGGFLFCHFHRF